MKNSYDLEKHIDSKYNTILNYDKSGIDNPDKHHYRRLMYIDRLTTVIKKIRERFPVSEGVKIGDFACAQANMSLLLAELGYKVFAIDIYQTFLEYSKLKYEKGDIEWVNANIDDMDFPSNSLDVAIMGEIIEHCAYPEDIIEKVLGFVKPGGFVIITTPNGARLFTKRPSFKEFFSREKREVFLERQFGPAGKDHLFLFRQNEIPSVLPENAKVIEKGFQSSTILINKYSYKLFKILPIKFIEKLIRFLAQIPIINTKTFNNFYVVVEKES